MNVVSLLRLAYLGFIAFLSTSLQEGASFGVEAFLIPSILMGTGIAIDVLIATVSKFQDEHISWRNWTLPVTITHILFPAVGYFIFWSLDETFPLLHGALGIIGFWLVALYIHEVLADLNNTEPIFGISAWMSEQFGLRIGNTSTFVAVVAVSWDALWSGPARAAQAAAAGWNGIEVFVSFIIAGVVVAIVAELALSLTRHLRAKNYQGEDTIAQYSLAGTYLELSVIGGFGILSLWHVFSDAANLYMSIATAAILLLFFFIPKYKVMRTIPA